MKTSNLLTTLLAAVMLLGTGFGLTACNDDDDSANASTVKPEVLVLFSLDGVGDGSYNDQILRGIKLMENEYNQKVSIRFVTPKSMEDVESLCTSWWAKIDEPADKKARFHAGCWCWHLPITLNLPDGCLPMPR